MLFHFNYEGPSSLEANTMVFSNCSSSVTHLSEFSDTFFKHLNWNSQKKDVLSAKHLETVFHYYYL